MARIRTIKPEFWTSAQVMECSPMTRLLFIGMLNFADDAGRMSYSPKTLKAQIYPSDDISVGDVKDMIVELSSNGLILIYSSEDKEFIWITGWHHQKIDKPRPSKLPGPFDEGSSKVSRKVATDLILSEGKGRDQKGSDPETRASALLVGCPPDFRERFWSRYPNKVGKPKALAKLEQCIRRGVSFDEIMIGLDRYIANKPPDRAWLNPETFINQERWADQPAAVTNGRRTVQQAADDLIAKLRAFDEPAPDGLCDGTGENVIRMLPPH